VQSTSPKAHWHASANGTFCAGHQSPWSGNCSYYKYPAVDLIVFPSNSSNYQNEVPQLGPWLPVWATIDPQNQGTSYSGFYDNAAVNGSGVWKDMLVTYVFGSVAKDATLPSIVNISFANFAAHNVARDPNTTFLQTAFRSDVHVVDCTFDNAMPGAEDQANVGGNDYANAAQNVNSVSSHVFFLSF
jgi:hypothetical protein